MNLVAVKKHSFLTADWNDRSQLNYLCFSAHSESLVFKQHI